MLGPILNLVRGGSLSDILQRFFDIASHFSPQSPREIEIASLISTSPLGPSSQSLLRRKDILIAIDDPRTSLPSQPGTPCHDGRTSLQTSRSAAAEEILRDNASAAEEYQR